MYLLTDIFITTLYYHRLGKKLKFAATIQIFYNFKIQKEQCPRKLYTETIQGNKVDFFG